MNVLMRDLEERRSLAEETLEPMIVGAMHARRMFKEMADEYPSIAVFVPIPAFLVSLPELYARGILSMNRWFAFVASTFIGKQPLLLPNSSFIPDTVPLSCQWGEVSTVHRSVDGVADAASCYMDEAVVRKYPIAEALAYGHTPFFEHIRFEWSRAMTF